MKNILLVKTFVVLILTFLCLGIFFDLDAGLVYTETYNTYNSPGEKKIVILVEEDIYEPLFQSLKQFIGDLEAEDYSITLVKFSSGTVAEIKDYLRMFLPYIKGVIMVGDIPYARFEIKKDFDVYGYIEFPCDIYFMELDTPWIDTDNNGIYDTIGVATQQEMAKIWVGRLMSSPIKNPAMDEVLLLKNYFNKNHRYRTAAPSISHRALSYIDDDWNTRTSHLGMVYADVAEIKEKTLTIAADYKNRLAQDYEWIHVWVHSTPNYHRFKINDVWEKLLVKVTSGDILSIDPRSLFYNLFACSSGHFVFPDNLAGHYTFASRGGLLTVGSTKPGGMQESNYFYEHLSFQRRKSVGEGFLEWFNLIGKYDKSWYYGMVMVGDPSLSIDPPRAFIDNIDKKGNEFVFRGMGRINQGQITEYKWRSDKDGFLSNQQEFKIATLSRGEHNIYLKVKDNFGRWSSEVSNKVVVEDYLSGDVSGDGRISSYDAALVAQHVVGLITLTPEQILRADLSGDGNISSYDASLILRIAVGV